MPQPARVRLALLAVSVLAPLSVSLLAAPAASADEKPPPPGLASLPHPSSAGLHAVPATQAHGRKLR